MSPRTPGSFALRGEILHFLPAATPAGHRTVHLPDGLLVVQDGRVASCASWPGRAPAVPVTRVDGLIIPGMVDAHVHYPQLDVLASPAPGLLDWLDRYTFPAEARFADPAHARREADRFLDAMLACGTTSALVFATSHEVAADALFAAAHRRRLRLVTGKVLSDRNVPAALRDSPRRAREESARLIARWHGKGRLGYAVTPRFAPTSTARQLAVAGELLAAHPGVLLHTHISENRAEIALVRRLFPKARDYLDVYDAAGLVTDRSVFAHGIHLGQREWRRLAAAGAKVAFCPCSNLFLGSGLFRIARARRHGVPVGLGSDVGGGNALSLMRVMDEAYKVARLAGDDLDPLALWHLATLGGARTLGIDAHVGSFAPGNEADIVVLDPTPVPLLADRLHTCTTVAEKAFAYAMLGDERCVSAVWVMGRRVGAPRG